MNTTTNENSNAPKTGLITAILVAIYAAVLLLMLSSKTLTANAKEESYTVYFYNSYERQLSDGDIDYSWITSTSATIPQGYTFYGYWEENDDGFYNEEGSPYFRLCIVADGTTSIIEGYEDSFHSIVLDEIYEETRYLDGIPTCTTHDKILYRNIFRVSNLGGINYEMRYVNVAYSANFPIFDSKEALKTYLATGDDSGQVNKPKIEKTETDFTLLGFDCILDNGGNICASWTGFVCKLPLTIDFENNIYVEVSPSYVVLLDKDQEFIDWEEPPSEKVAYTAMKHSNTYAYYMDGCPYKCLFYMYYTPVLETEGITYRGQTIKVSFDASGSMSGVVYPESAKGTPVLDTECGFVGFSSTEVSPLVDSYYRFFWDGITSSEADENMYNKTIHVEIIDKHKSGTDLYVYSTEDYFWKDRYFSLTSAEIYMFLKEKGTGDGVFNYIKLTPYYETDTGIFYGRSVFVDFNDPKNPTEGTGDTPSDIPVATPTPVPIDPSIPDTNEELDIDGMLKSFFNMLKALVAYSGQIPILVNQIFGFLPPVYTSMIVVALGVAIILRLIGR